MTTTDRLTADYYTIPETAALLRLSTWTVRFYNRQGILPRSVLMGRALLIHRDDILRLKRFGPRVLLAELRYAAEERGRTGTDGVDTAATDAAQRARAFARAEVLQARLRRVQQHDLAKLDAQPLPPPPSDDLPDIVEVDPLRVALIIRELGPKPINTLSNTELFELHRRMQQLMRIAPAVEVPARQRGESSPDLRRPANRDDMPLPPPPPPPPPGFSTTFGGNGPSTNG